METKSTILSALHLSNEAFLEVCRSDDIVHVATHGDINYEQPLESYIALQEPLRVRDLRNIDSRTKLLFMSACFTALGSSTKADDLAGFQATILEIGALAFAGSLWNVSAVASLFMVYCFYDELARSTIGETTKLIDVFTSAQHRLRQLRRADMQIIVDELRAILDTDANASRIPVDILKDSKIFYKKLDSLRDGFASPLFWAPFVFVGYA